MLIPILAISTLSEPLAGPLPSVSVSSRFGAKVQLEETLSEPLAGPLPSVSVSACFVCYTVARSPSRMPAGVSYMS